jgi:hypothetical protein
VVVGAHRIGTLPKVHEVHAGSPGSQNHLGKRLLDEFTYSDARFLLPVRPRNRDDFRDWCWVGVDLPTSRPWRRCGVTLETIRGLIQCFEFWL